MRRPYVTLSCAMSIDGYLDSAAPHKLAMSNSADFDRVDQLRADSDAIMVGASTVRLDDPRLLVRSEARQLMRTEAGLPCSPVKVTVTGTGEIPCEAAFFREGDAEKLVYCPVEVAPGLAARLDGAATVVGHRVECGDDRVAVAVGLGHELEPRHLAVDVEELVVTASAQLVHDVHRPCGAALRRHRDHDVAVAPGDVLLQRRVDPRRGTGGAFMSTGPTVVGGSGLGCLRAHGTTS